MSNVKTAAKCLRVWPDAYHMGAHDRHVCKIAADALDEIGHVQAVVDAVRVCQRVGFKAIQVSTQQISGDLLMEALTKLDSTRALDP